MIEDIDIQGDFSMNEMQSEQSGVKSLSPVDSLKALTSAVLTEDACRHWILSCLHPNGINCPQCKSRLTDETTVKNFWQGKRCHCKVCKKRFFPTDGTILHRSRLSMKQSFALAFLIALGVENKKIAEIVGIHPDSVRLWRLRFESNK